jgi:hypothetical protein
MTDQLQNGKDNKAGGEVARQHVIERSLGTHHITLAQLAALSKHFASCAAAYR